ncbi:MAG: DUF1295 domain-containing protein [Acidobacteriota bacterium]
MKKLLPLLPFLAGWVVLVSTNSLQTRSLVNGGLQMVLFLLVVCLPTWRTGRMSYVDIGWPWGLVVIGAVTLVMSEGHTVRIAMVSGVYLLIGGRMGIYALRLWQKGAFAKEFPRYRYQEVRWRRKGLTDFAFVRQVDVIMQGLANASFLAMPAFLVAINPTEGMHWLEIIGFAVALTALFLESVADAQKARFVAQSNKAGERNRVCNVGLWRYSRHPNYFFEWMVWNGLILMAIPALPHLFELESTVIAVLLTMGLFFVSRLMYMTLVHFTGAKPSEYYSVQKRPDYAEYQRTTNRFFPGPQRT